MSKRVDFEARSFWRRRLHHKVVANVAVAAVAVADELSVSMTAAISHSYRTKVLKFPVR